MKGRYALSILKEYQINVYYLMILVDFELSYWLKNYYLIFILSINIVLQKYLKINFKRKKMAYLPP